MSRPTVSQPPSDRVTAWLRRRLGLAVVLSYVAALLLPSPGLWLRRDHTVPLGAVTGLPLSTAPLLLSLLLFSAGLQVPVRELGRLLRKPTALLAGLVLHLVIPLLVIPVVAFGLHRTPDSDGGSGLITAMILIVAMPVAAGATVWTGKGDGDQPTMVGLVLASTLLSPLTIPLIITTLVPLLDDSYANTLARTGQTAHGGFALITVVLPCAVGILFRLALPTAWLSRALRVIVPVALTGSLVLTYVNASGALGSFLAHPRPLLFGAALVVAALVCLLSFVLGQTAARLLRLDAPASSSLTLACGMNNSSASAVLITTTLPDKPHLLLPVLAYGLLQKTAASRVVAAASRA
ncbi:bile acid:sodium symporter family protein [Streptomyces stelliscabiei]|uniref:sodium-dependent transporter n=1 Tax=Streptomyces stelliscabiei TaxID=146820 RepID=UPI0029BD022E|nr:sodium-dependent transporter [Streptomyces stelliscabiei]MDX3435774.1 sodium-dependent transporter [Streptomyces stelliscabiei]MDX3621927.1 sodium-dependent transporter [Streptomyces stelliscabiei]